MRVIFGLFETYPNAKAAVDKLLEQGFSEGQINALVQEEAAKNYLETDLQSVHADVTAKVGEQKLHGLDRLVGRQIHNPLTLPGLGKVYAAGDEVTLLTKTASPDSNVHGGLESALVELGVSEEAATTYREGVTQGGILIFIRSDDEKAWQAAAALRDHNAKHVDS